jgi:hypothetical protein
MLHAHRCRRAPRSFYHTPTHVVECILLDKRYACSSSSTSSPATTMYRDRAEYMSRPLDPYLLMCCATWTRWREVRGLWLLAVRIGAVASCVSGIVDTPIQSTAQHPGLSSSTAAPAEIEGIITSAALPSPRRDGTLCIAQILCVQPLRSLIQSFLISPPKSLSIQHIMRSVCQYGLWDKSVASDDLDDESLRPGGKTFYWSLPLL